MKSVINLAIGLFLIFYGVLFYNGMTLFFTLAGGWLMGNSLVDIFVEKK